MMSIGSRKVVIASIIVAVLLLANAGTIVGWLYSVGVIPLAEYIRSEYITGTAIAITVALLVLLPSRTVWAICVRRCPVCDGLLLRRGKYCGECGSRV